MIPHHNLKEKHARIIVKSMGFKKDKPNYMWWLQLTGMILGGVFYAAVMLAGLGWIMMGLIQRFTS